MAYEHMLNGWQLESDMSYIYICTYLKGVFTMYIDKFKFWRVAKRTNLCHKSKRLV